MFNFFKAKPKYAADEIIGVATKPTSGYPAIVVDIHNEFNNAGDRLLKEAKDIIANATVFNEQKANALSEFGFKSTKEVIEKDAVIKKKTEQQMLAEALEYFNVNFPQYKFITQEATAKICKKYDLVLGEVSQYTGFVPEKNIEKIKSFYAVKNEINMQYTQSYTSIWSSPKVITKSEYDSAMEQKRIIRQMAAASNKSHSFLDHVYYNEKKVPLSIVAPLKDMKSEGYKLMDRIFTKEIPDPIVVAPVKYKDVELYCIVTAWGDEASDDLVVNETMN